MAIATGRRRRTPAVREFTDRTEPRSAFRTRFQKMEREGTTLISFYGAGGVGKTSLLRKLQEDITCTGRNDIAFTHSDFEKTSDTLSIIQEMRYALENQGCIFPLFSTGEFYYFVNTGKRNELDAPKIMSVMDRNTWLRKVKNNWAKTVAIVDFFAPGVNAVATAVSIVGDALIDYWKGEKIFDEEHEDMKFRLNAARFDKNPYEIYKLLPELFAQDVKDWLKSNKSGKDYLVVFLDTYEALVNEAVAAPIQRDRDAWLRSETGDPTGIIFLIPNTLWVIAGRNKLRWGGELAAELDQHLITALSQDDSNYFLEKAGIATKQLRDDLYHLTKGLPIFLDVCVDVYTEYKQRNVVEPDISVFGNKREEIVDRLFKYMDDGTQDMIKFLCILGRWTDKIAFELGTKIFNFSPTTYGKAKNFSFIQSEDFLIDDTRVENFSVELFSFDRTVQSILFPSCDKFIIEKTKEVADKYFSELLTDELSKVNGEYLFCLDYWARLTARLAETPEELRERYEKNFYVHVVMSTEFARFEVAKNILKIFMDEFTEETGKFKAFQESVAFAYLEGDFGILKQAQGFYQEAYEYSRNAYEKFLHLLGEKAEDTLEAMNSLANTLIRLRNYDEALNFQEKIFALSKEIFGEEASETLRVLGNLTVSLRRLGRYDETLKYQEKILSWFKETLGEDNEDTIQATLNLAKTLRDMGRYEEAWELYNRVFELIEDDPFKLIATAKDAADLLSDLGRHEEALNFQQETLSLCKEIFGEESPKTVDAMNDLVFTLLYLERYDEALPLQEKVLAFYKETLGEDDEKTIAVMDILALTLLNLECYEEALPLQEKVLAFRKELLGEDDEDTIISINNLALILKGLGRDKEAKKIIKRALELGRKILPADSDLIVEIKDTYDQIFKF